MVASNNRRMQAHAADRSEPNPRRLGPDHWNQRLEAREHAIRAEWRAFAQAGRRLPELSDLIDEDQGNQGSWQAGLLVSRGRPVPPLADRFPDTIAALLSVPGMWSALWSVLDAGTELPEHQGPNAGVLRYHLGIDCGADSALQVAGTTTPYVDGRGLLFDDTAPHAAWNRGTRRRVTLFCEVVRPARGATRLANLAVQRLLALDHRYAGAPAKAEEWDRTLNS